MKPNNDQYAGNMPFDPGMGMTGVNSHGKQRYTCQCTETAPSYYLEVSLEKFDYIRHPVTN